MTCFVQIGSNWLGFRVWLSRSPARIVRKVALVPSQLVLLQGPPPNFQFPISIGVKTGLSEANLDPWGTASSWPFNRGGKLNKLWIEFCLVVCLFCLCSSLVCILHQSRDSDQVYWPHEWSTTDPHDTRINACDQKYWCGWYYVVWGTVV